ncbi:hypothetical protein V8G54_005737 [Vigna mungo]|uniref:Uncharacterized protein n=1 Tax=Vigna mungo TaxID=3915 RepID=A0AAQ3NZT8_VIGMU
MSCYNKASTVQRAFHVEETKTPKIGCGIKKPKTCWKSQVLCWTVVTDSGTEQRITATAAANSGYGQWLRTVAANRGCRQWEQTRRMKEGPITSKKVVTQKDSSSVERGAAQALETTARWRTVRKLQRDEANEDVSNGCYGGLMLTLGRRHVTNTHPRSDGEIRRVRRSLVLSSAGLAVTQGGGPDPLVTGRNWYGGRRRTVAGGGRWPATDSNSADCGINNRKEIMQSGGKEPLLSCHQKSKVLIDIGIKGRRRPSWPPADSKGSRLPNTGSGHETEKWQQGSNPKFKAILYGNGFPNLMGSKEGAFDSLHYNENIFILSLQGFLVIFSKVHLLPTKLFGKHNGKKATKADESSPSLMNWLMGDQVLQQVLLQGQKGILEATTWEVATIKD